MAASVSDPTPPGCPPTPIYIPRSQRTSLIHTAHTSLGTGHPATNQTLSLLQDRFWWPGMANDIRRYVRGSQECATAKTPHHLPSGKFLPLPIPWCPWSHLEVDFVTDLPASDGNTCILVTVDRLSKACRLVPLKGLPTAMETAEVLFNHVFRNFGIPKDIVSDRGSPFISQVWRSFFSLLGETVSLSSGYHPQSNGQIERKIQEIGATSVPSATATRTPGTDSSPGPSLHRTLSISPLRISPHSSAYSATSHLFSPGLRNLRRYHQSLIGSRRVRGSGTQHINISSVQYDITNIMRMSREPPLPPSTHNRRNGSPPGISD